LDENIAHSLRHHLGKHRTLTASYAGFAGLKNGALLDAAEAEGFRGSGHWRSNASKRTEFVAPEDSYRFALCD
jgi:hypothetical protein